MAVATRVKTEEELISAKNQLILLPDAPSVTHIMYAYKLQDKIGYDEDGEYGAHKHLLKALRQHDNTLVAVLRWSGPHMGPKRFDKIEELAGYAIDNVEERDEKTLDDSETW